MTVQCRHRINNIRATIREGVYSCKQCRSLIGSSNLLRSMQEVAAKVDAIERYIGRDADICEGCEDWRREGFVEIDTHGHWCPSCLRAQIEDPDSDISEAIDEDDSRALDDLMEFLTPEVLAESSLWRGVHNALARNWPGTSKRGRGEVR